MVSYKSLPSQSVHQAQMLEEYRQWILVTVMQTNNNETDAQSKSDNRL